MKEAMAMPDSTEEERQAKIRKVKALYVSLGIDVMAGQEIVRLTEEALEFASRLELTKVRYEMLKRFADKLVGRKS